MRCTAKMSLKIGIITDLYHRERKLSPFLNYLKRKCEFKVYIEEDFLFNIEYNRFTEDVFFIKGKGDLILSFAKLVERTTSIPIYNSSRGIWIAMHRFINSTLLKSKNIPVPNFCLIPQEQSPPYENYIAKNLIDQKNYAFSPQIKKKHGKLQVIDGRALEESESKSYNSFVYYQQFIKSKWEYKFYAIGDKILFFKQLPILVNPNKMESRREINHIPEIETTALKVMNILGLKICSMDFLKDKSGTYYLTDVNSTPNFNYIKNGSELVYKFLKKEAKM